MLLEGEATLQKNICMQWLSRGTPAVLRDERNSSYVDPFTWEQTVLIIYLSTLPIEAFLIPLNFFLCHIYPQFFLFYMENIRNKPENSFLFGTVVLF